MDSSQVRWVNLEEFDLRYRPCGIHKIYFMGSMVAKRSYDKGRRTVPLETWAVCVKMLRTEKPLAV